MRHLVLILAAWGWAAACQSAPAPSAARLEMMPEPRAAVRPPRKLTADSVLETLSVREKVGQLIVPWVASAYIADDDERLDSLAAWIDRYGLGGIMLSVGGSPLDAADKINRLQRRSRLPLLVAADFEYGVAMRISGATAFPPAMAFGATGRELDAYQMGRITALEARAIGVHWTFSPVADLNNNPDNPIINTRSFGEDPLAVSRLIAAYVRGAADHQLFTTAKHFPGHGDTGTDSHIEVPVAGACWDRLNALELGPFRAAIAEGVTSVMLGHIALPCIDGSDGLPASLLPSVAEGILRDSLGFEGVVVPDALDMGAIVSRFGPGEATVRAFLAGNDFLLLPTDLGISVNAMVEAVENGRISTERLDRSVRRMLQMKDDMGLFEERTVSLDRVTEIVGRRAHQEIADDIAARALTLVQSGPIDTFRRQRGRTAVIAYADENNLSIGSSMIRELRDYGETVTSFRLYPASGPASYDSALAVVAQTERTIFAVNVRPISGRGHIELPAVFADLVTRVDRTRRPTALVSFGSPYLLNQLMDYTGTYLLAWSGITANERAAGRALAGAVAITGRTPITLSDRFPRGSGILLAR